MIEAYQLWNSYWEDKKPQLSKIKVPMYATCSYSTGLHTEGSLRGFFLSSSAEKWFVYLISVHHQVFTVSLGYDFTRLRNGMIYTNQKTSTTYKNSWIIT